MILRSERVSTPEFPIPPRDATEEQRRWYREFQNIFERYVLNAQLPPHTKGLGQFLRHDATAEKLTWTTLPYVPILAGRVYIDPAGATSAVVSTTLVTSKSIIICTPQDINPDTAYAWCDSRIVGTSFTIAESGFASAHLVGYLMLEPQDDIGGGAGGNCPLQKTVVVTGSTTAANNGTWVLTWNTGTGYYVAAAPLGGIFTLKYFGGFEWLLQAPSNDTWALVSAASCPPNGSYPLTIGTGTAVVS